MNSKLYFDAIAADKAYSDELIRLFGKAAGDARYDKRGESTEILKALSAAKLKADAALHESCVSEREAAAAGLKAEIEKGLERT